MKEKGRKPPDLIGGEGPVPMNIGKPLREQVKEKRKKAAAAARKAEAKAAGEKARPAGKAAGEPPRRSEHNSDVIEMPGGGKKARAKAKSPVVGAGRGKKRELVLDDEDEAEELAVTGSLVSAARLTD